MALAGLTDEERFALDTYGDPMLSTDEKLARIRAYGTDIGGMVGGLGSGVTAGLPANDPVAAPSNDNGLAPIPAGPGLPPEATADLSGAPRVQLGPPRSSPMKLDAPPAAPASRVQIVDAPTSPLESAIPVLPPIGSRLPGQVERKDIRVVDAAPADQFGLGSALPGNGLVLPTNEQVIRDRREINAETEQAVGANPKDLVFADPGAAGQPGAASRPQVVTVGTDTFVPHARTTRGAVDLAAYEQGEPGEPEFGVAGFETQTVIDPKTGKQIKTKVPKGLAIEEGEPGEVRRKPLEPQFQEAEGREEQAQLDQQAGREYADDAILRQAVAVEDKIRQIEEERIARENERARRLEEKQARFQAVLDETGNTENPVDAYMANRETGDKITSAIAVALGTLGEAMSGVKNSAMQMLDNAIQAEIEMQRDKRRMRIEGARTLYDMASDVFETEAARDAATREAAYARVQREIERFKAFAQTPERRAQFDELLAQADQRRLGAQAQRIQAMQGEIVVQEKFDPKRQVVVGGGKIKEDHRKRLVRLPDGSFAFSRDEKRTEKIQDQLKVDNRISEAAQRIRRLRGQPGSQIGPETRSQIEGAAADLFVALKQGANLGTLDKGALDFRDEWIGGPLILSEIIADPRKYVGVDAKLQEVARAAGGRVRDTMKYDLDRDPEAPSPVIGEDAPASAERGATR